MKRYRVFLSYSRKDRSLTDRLKLLLNQLGVEVWRDLENLLVATDVQKAITQAIKNDADFFLVALSDHSQAAPWVKYEEEFAKMIQESGAHLKTVYIKISDTYVPDEIKGKLYVDLSMSMRDKLYQENLIKLAQFFLVDNHPYRSFGIYDIYTSYSDMDSRREDGQGRHGCNVDKYVASARHSVIAVGLWYGALFGPNSAAGIETFLKGGNGRVHLFVPDPDASPMEHLRKTHNCGHGVEERIRGFISNFKSWGKTRGLSRDQADRCTLHLINLIPVNSFLCLDFGQANCRMLIDVFAAGIVPEDQLKLELRYTNTPLFEVYSKSLTFIMDSTRTSKTLTTAYI
ncbi:toll/interleukin-1 receptor domain-containing protein [Paraburkholderia sp. MM5477-R1]|uniref:toll/interleukin-1 receptor domain-containing protein n=1 Tax=Paraburkholderia sp. MM5477-R1 TaxID=2991062 RepID=UPI003D1AF999